MNSSCLLWLWLSFCTCISVILPKHNLIVKYYSEVIPRKQFLNHNLIWIFINIVSNCYFTVSLLDKEHVVFFDLTYLIIHIEKHMFRRSQFHFHLPNQKLQHLIWILFQNTSYNWVVLKDLPKDLTCRVQLQRRTYVRQKLIQFFLLILSCLCIYEEFFNFFPQPLGQV